MASYEVYLRDFQGANVVGIHTPDNLFWSIVNSDEGEMRCEIALGDPTIIPPATLIEPPEFGPYRTTWHLYRTGQSGSATLMCEGQLTSVNLNKDRDTILVEGKDWIHYLKRRIFPFDPVAYLNMETIVDATTQEAYFQKWPVYYPRVPFPPPDDVEAWLATNKIDARIIVEDMLAAMSQQPGPYHTVAYLPALPGGVPADTDVRGQIGLQWNNVDVNNDTSYKIYPGDSTTIYDHIKKIAEQVQGFEFDIIPGSREFKMWGMKEVSPVGSNTSPQSKRMQDQPVYIISPIPLSAANPEASGEVINVDWTNDGPDGTVLLGLGTGRHKAGQIWYYKPSVDQYSYLDKVHDFGEMADTDALLQMLKDQNDLYPQQKLALTLLNPEFLTPSFFNSGRPRSLIGNRIRFRHNWEPYRNIVEDFKVNAINVSVDGSGNEEVEMELEIIYEEGVAPTP